MSKKKLFDEESEDEVAIKTENEYAKKYDAWREKEELHKLEQKYGSKPLNSDASSSSDSEDESDEPVEVTEEVEKQFLKTLALLKTKDPRIYDPNYKFFDEKLEKEKEKEPETKKLTFGDSDDDEDDDPNIFSIEKKAEIDHSDDDKNTNSGKSFKEDKLKDYLTGKVEHVDQELESDLAPLRALWSDPKINDGEAFLRDYILNKKYLEEGDAGEAEDKIRDDADLEEDEKQVEEQGKFERAYNFRFEEPDEEYLKRFPRTMNYIRPKDDRRSRKRAELRDRKEDEKKQKMEEIARMKALKLKEIQQKIAKIKEVTGNQELAFQEEDIEGDFDPEEHDRRMKALFDEQYYGETDDQKPVFPDLDEELEIENWDNYEHTEETPNVDDEGPHCEDDNFNMDADYDPKQAKLDLMEELKRNMGTKRRNRKRKSKLAQLLNEEKPKFVPDLDKKYSEFMEEYYKMDCEDVIGGDLPTRFKYREVVPNTFGLTIEEILLADDKELTQWVPLKKIVKYRPENVEKGEVKTYSQKAADERLKKKILPSLFKDLPEQPEIVVPPEEINKKRKKKKKKKNKEQDKEEYTSIVDGGGTAYKKVQENTVNNDVEQMSKKKSKKKHNNNNIEDNNNMERMEISTNDKNATEVELEKPKKKKKRKREINSESNLNEVDNSVMEVSQVENVTNNESKLKKKEATNSEVNNSKDLNNENNKVLRQHKKQQSEDNIIRRESINSESINTSGLKIDSNKVCRENKNPKKSFIIETVANAGPTKITEEKINDQKGSKKKNKYENSFVVETINAESKNISEIKVEVEKNNSLKRKSETLVGISIPKKKQKKNKNKQELQINTNKKDNKNKFKRKNKMSNSNEKSDNPLSNLSDERLKAYGLNPKKYRSFLKYKKF
ncbi:jg9656 [Pararge aegeria aegeria]|uniref:Protein KRI1 homolog n=1 Tax=Pararge aegeria aegeria TaxID=348720 RepID=A0A8S4RRB2_9NEOP|nr:jg9656 [Pararge aegeria aegeria]